MPPPRPYQDFFLCHVIFLVDETGAQVLIPFYLSDELQLSDLLFLCCVVMISLIALKDFLMMREDGDWFLPRGYHLVVKDGMWEFYFSGGSRNSNYRFLKTRSRLLRHRLS